MDCKFAPTRQSSLETTATAISFGAQQLGMKTILVCHTQDTSGPNADEPDRIIREFAELARVLDFFAALELLTSK
jgi:hypothetical protein